MKLTLNSRILNFTQQFIGIRHYFCRKTANCQPPFQHFQATMGRRKLQFSGEATFGQPGEPGQMSQKNTGSSRGSTRMGFLIYRNHNQEFGMSIRQIFTSLMVLSCAISVLKAQDITVSNPAVCRLQIALSDNNCPENNPNIFLPDEIGINVTNAPGSTLGVDVYLKEVRLIISHTWMSDLRIALISPGGRTALLLQDAGGSGDHLGNPSDTTCSQFATLGAGACTPIAQGTAPFLQQPFLPIQSLLTFNDSLTNPNGIWTLQICDDVANDMGVLHFIELVFEPLTCLPVTEKEILNVDGADVTLRWSPEGDCSNIIIEYGPPGFIPGSGFLAGTDGQVEIPGICPPYVLANLFPETEYDIYIRRFCPSGGFSGNGCPTRVRTGCRPPEPSVIETFDNLQSCTPNCGTTCPITGVWRNITSDDFDWTVFQDVTPTPNTGPLSGYNGAGKYLYIETSGTQCNQNRRAILESNCMLLRKLNTDTCHISFYYHMWGANVANLQFQVSDNGGFSWTTLWQRNGNQGSAWQKAFIGLGAFQEESVLKFRFVGSGGGGSQGDIALDQIVFHGSEDLGAGFFEYYEDRDGDGYGNENVVLQSCLTAPPPGFVELSGDCNDLSAQIHPGATEVACNGLDENCNGGDDDLQLPPPAAIGDTLCMGDIAEVCAQAGFGGFLLWYASPDGQEDVVGFEPCIQPILPPNLSPQPVTHYFYVEEFAPPCISMVRREVAVVINPTPDLELIAPVEVCSGNTLNLGQVTVLDSRYTGGILSFHTTSPAADSNRIDGTEFQPGQSTTLHARIITAEGCSDEAPLNVQVLSLPQLNFSPVDSFSLCKESTQWVTALPQGGAGGYELLWESGSTSDSLLLGAGQNAGDLDVYRVTVTDMAGCQATDSVLIRTTNSIDSIVLNVNHVASCGTNEGQISIQPLNGLPPFNYVWTSTTGVSGGAFGIPGAYTIQNLPQGNYRVTVSDSSNPPCPFVLRQVFVNGPDATIGPPGITPVRCPGGSDGRICLNVSGQNLSYLWSTGDTTVCITGLEAGQYDVTITAGACQTVLRDLQVTQPDSLRILPVLRPPTCAGSTNGGIQISSFGGQPTYFYQWSNGAQTKDLQGLGAGTYTLTLTDANSCTASRTVILSEPEPILIFPDSISNPRCFGASDGYIRAGAIGGAGSLRYAWSNGGNSQVLFNVASGSYQVTVTDNNQCQASRSFELSEPDSLALALEELLPPLCPGNEEGRLRISGSGGTAPYHVTWSNGDTSLIADSLGTGNYQVSFTDANQCGPVVRSFELSATSNLDLQILSQPPSCVGRTNGSIILLPEGTGPFSYYWPDDESTESQRSGLGVGTYEVMITDGRGCNFESRVELVAPQVFQTSLLLRNLTCHETEDGIIDLTLVQAGQGPFQFLWNNGSQTEDLIGVGAGTYSITITDMLGCRYESPPIIISEPDPLQMELIGIGPVLCHGESNGYVEVSMSGGTPPYSNPTQYGIPAGIYFLQGSDANSCPVNLTVNVPTAPPLQAGVNIIRSGDCSLSIGTSLQASVNGGIQPYQYLWSNGSMAPVINQAAPGDYSLTVTDAHGCVRTVTSIKVLPQIPPLLLEDFTAQPISCFGAADGALTVRVQGGSGNFRYHFSTNQIIFSQEDSIRVAGLSPGTSYRVTVTDLNSNCVIVAGPLAISQPLPFVFYRSSISPVVCHGDSTGGIQAISDGGTPPYTFEWYNQSGHLVGEMEDLIGVPAGNYYAIGRDSRGCTAQLPLQNINHLYDPVVLVDSTTFFSPRVCDGSTNGFITADLEGGVGPYHYAWSNGNSEPSLINLPPGSYSLTVTDQMNCSFVLGPFELVSSPLPQVGIDATPPDTGGNNGGVTALASGGTPPYHYFWSTGDTTINVSPLMAGTYDLTVTDAAGCVGTASAVLVSSDEVGQGSSPRLFPNPGSSDFFFEINPEIGQIQSLFIRNAMGQMVWQQQQIPSGQQVIKISLAHVPSGLYLLEAPFSNGSTFRQFFVIQR